MKKIILFSAASLMLFTSCNLDINNDPNYPGESDVTGDLIFPSVENSVADATGDAMFNYAGFFAQYFDQKPEQNQYNDEAELHIDEAKDLFTRPYRTLYAGALMDIKDILSKDKNPADIYACTVMRTYIYQLLVDNMSDAPYTESLQGNDNTMPKWDDGKTIYEGVLKEIDLAEANLSSASSMTLTDPLLNEDLGKWKQFANALRLRMYLRLIDGGIDADTYTSKVKTLLTLNNFFTGDIKFGVYSDGETQYNPWYGAAFKLGTENCCAAYPLISYYQLTGDPRESYAIYKNAKDNKYVGQIPGAKTKYLEWTGAEWKNDQVSAINYEPAKTMPVYFFTQSEIQFLIAESQLRFNSDDNKAKGAYIAGVEADFSSRGVTGVTSFLSTPNVNWDEQTDVTAKLKLICRSGSLYSIEIIWKHGLKFVVQMYQNYLQYQLKIYIKVLLLMSQVV